MQICVWEGHESGGGKVEEKLFERKRMEGTSKRKAQRMLRKWEIRTKYNDMCVKMSKCNLLLCILTLHFNYRKEKSRYSFQPRASSDLEGINENVSI